MEARWLALRCCAALALVAIALLAIAAPSLCANTRVPAMMNCSNVSRNSFAAHANDSMTVFRALTMCHVPRDQVAQEAACLRVLRWLRSEFVRERRRFRG